MNVQVERWDIFEVKLTSSCEYQNPFRDVSVEALFKNGKTEKRITGFYDGNQTWIVRFMPEELGEYQYCTLSSDPELNNQTGSFECTAPREGNHGPVRVTNTFHFSYADQTPFFLMGTTGYAWFYRPEEIRKQSLASFEKYRFNKVRMMFMPKHYWGEDGDVDISYDPPCYPFEGKPNDFDFYRVNPEYFRNYEERIADLRDLGIEADVILFHYCDFGMFGLDEMNEDEALFYIKYIVSRLSAYRNVWWTLCNEYDAGYEFDENKKGTLVKTVTNRRNWDVIGELIKALDPYGHPRANHNYPNGEIYPNRPWMTHVVYQHPNTYDLLKQLRNDYQKPVVNDEYQYEGNLRYDWGNCTAEEEVFRHWLSVMAGGYATHGEVYRTPDNNRDLFWTYGGTMIGQSAPRLKYLREIVESCDFQHMSPDWRCTDGLNCFGIKKDFDQFLIFCRHDNPRKPLYPGNAYTGEYFYHVEVFNVWECKKVREYDIDWQTPIKPEEWTVFKLTKNR